jgi:D-alanyl-D-alanine dipeptidase
VKRDSFIKPGHCSFYFLLLVVFFLQIVSPAQLLAQSEGDLVNIRSVDSTIVLDIRYATANNFTHQVLYPAAICMLRRAAAESLHAVQQDLQKKKLGLKVFDGYRPLSVQKKMWALVPDDRYVANPANGSRHNRGAAVDLTIVDSLGSELEMPTPFDDFTEKAHRDYLQLPEKAIEDRALLEEVMKRHGFIPLSTEWWHFDFEGWKKFSIMDEPLK